MEVALTEVHFIKRSIHHGQVCAEFTVSAGSSTHHFFQTAEQLRESIVTLKQVGPAAKLAQFEAALNAVE